jgi:hypothetical protein
VLLTYAALRGAVQTKLSKNVFTANRQGKAALRRRTLSELRLTLVDCSSSIGHAQIRAQRRVVMDGRISRKIARWCSGDLRGQKLAVPAPVSDISLFRCVAHESVGGEKPFDLCDTHLISTPEILPHFPAILEVITTCQAPRQEVGSLRGHDPHTRSVGDFISPICLFRYLWLC